MALKGDLASVDLAQMFQMLALNKKVGLLSIQSPKLWKVLYFDGRGVTLYYNPHYLLDRAISAFVRGGRLEIAAVEELRAHSSRNQLPLQDALLAGGYLEESDLAGQMRYELEEEIYALFFCKDARFEFHEGVDRLPDHEGVVDDRFFFHTDSVIMEAARRIDEWAYIAERIPSPLEVFCPTDRRLDPRKVDEFGAIVHAQVDGCRSIARIIELTALPEFTVYKSLSQLADAGFVMPVPPDDLLPLGQQCLEQGRTQEAVQLLEKAIELGIGIPSVHSMAAEACRAAGEYERTIYHLQCEAEYRIGDGDLKTACERLAAAVELVPTDLAARERLVEIALEHGVHPAGFDGVEAGKQLVELYLAAGEMTRVRGVLERLLQASPEDLELKKVLVNVHTKAGDQPRVIELYLSIADDLVREHRPLEAIGYLQKILMLDRSRADVSERLRGLYALDERTRRRRRTLWGLGVFSGLLAVLGVTYQYYDRHATVDFDRIDVRALVAANEFEQAEIEYRNFVAEHPLATSIGRAEEELQRLAGMRLSRDAERASQRAARERSLGSLRQDYRAEWRRYTALFEDGKPEEALACVERVRKLVAEAGQQDDHAWALEEQVENTFARLSSFVQTATELRRRLDETLATGDIDAARTIAVDLVSNYEIAAAARGAMVPVVLRSRPDGALVLRDGQPLQTVVGGIEQPLRTPAVVLCGRDPATFALELAGFRPTAVTVDGRKQASVDVPLDVVPERSIHFPEPATVVALGNGILVAGLRTGHVSIAAAATGQVQRTIELGGLKAIEGEPVITGDRVWFASNEQTLECLALSTGAAPAGWPVKLDRAIQGRLAIRDGRIVFTDVGGQVVCLEQATGRTLWSQHIDGAFAGSPAIENRQVRIASDDGTVRVLDFVTGTLVRTVQLGVPITTRVIAEGSTWWVGGKGGKVHAWDLDRNAMLWTSTIGGEIDDDRFALTEHGVVVLGASSDLVSLDRRTGDVRATRTLPGNAHREAKLRVSGSRLSVWTRTREGKEKPRDALSVHATDSLTLLYDYAPAGVISGFAGADGQTVVVGPEGDVVLLR